MDSADRQRLKRLLHEYGEVTDFEFQFRRRDGEIRTAHESSFVTRDDSGAIVAYQGFVLDVTERKQAEIEIRRRNRELLALNVIAELLSQSSTLEEVLTRALAKITELFAADVASVYFLDESVANPEARRQLRVPIRLCAPTGSRPDFRVAAAAGSPGPRHVAVRFRAGPARGVSRAAAKGRHSGVAGGGPLGQGPHHRHRSWSAAAKCANSRPPN